MTLPIDLSTREANKFVDVSNSQTAVRVRDSKAVVNDVEQDTLALSTTAAALELPESSSGFTIFHQDAARKVYFGDSSVSTSGYPYLSNGDILSLDVDDTTELYFRTDSGTATLFILTGVKA